MFIRDYNAFKCKEAGGAKRFRMLVCRPHAGRSEGDGLTRRRIKPALRNAFKI